MGRAAQGAGGVSIPGGGQGMWHSGLGDEVGMGHSWSSDLGGLFQAQGFWDSSKTKKFGRVEGEVGEVMRQKDSGKHGALSPLSPISPSLPAQLFSPDTAEENPSAG